MRTRFVLIASLFICLGACGGGTGLDSGETIPIDRLSARAIELSCAHGVACGAYPDVATCQEALSSPTPWAADVAAGRILYDGHAAAVCLHTYDGLGCGYSDLFRAFAATADVCAQALKGTLSRGAACLENEECASTHCAKVGCTSDTCCMGTCTDRVAVGGDCSAAGARCAAGLVCQWASTGGSATCIVPIPIGQACTSSGACADGALCLTTPTSTTKLCGAPPATGAACPDEICDDQRDVCDPASHTCVRRIAVGGTCAVNRDSCVIYAHCDAATSTCVSRKRAGDACGDSSDCLSAFTCKGGLCVAPPDQAACSLP